MFPRRHRSSCIEIPLTLSFSLPFAFALPPSPPARFGLDINVHIAVSSLPHGADGILPSPISITVPISIPLLDR
jgi:hypothetical protein